MRSDSSLSVDWPVAHDLREGPSRHVAVSAPRNVVTKNRCRVWAGRPLQFHAMTAREALEQANAAAPGERLHRFEAICGPRGECKRAPVIGNTGRWTWCAGCPDESIWGNGRRQPTVLGFRRNRMKRAPSINPTVPPAAVTIGRLGPVRTVQIEFDGIPFASLRSSDFVIRSEMPAVCLA